MIFGFSTSSRLASVAVLDDAGAVLWEGAQDAPQSASGACMGLLALCRETTGVSPADASVFAADIGPGSFTGVRVGIVLAKTFAYLYGKHCVGANSFDLISPTDTVVLPSKRGEYFVRVSGQEPFRQTGLPEGNHVGFGPDLATQQFPRASGFGRLIPTLTPVSAELFVPEYLIEPSISIPKKPFPGVIPS